jgi:hypothetical protein
MKTFEDFWNENKDNYLDYIKKVAHADFEALKQTHLGKYVAHIDIDTDDDFYFENGTSFKIYANTKKDLITNSIEFLTNLKITYGSESKWEWLKNEAISRLKNKNLNFDFGGNQQMSFYTYEVSKINQPTYKNKI